MIASEPAATVVYNAGCFEDEQRRLRGNKHSAGELILLKGIPTMGDKSPKSAQKKASQKQAASNVENQKKQNLISSQQATKTKLAAGKRK